MKKLITFLLALCFHNAISQTLERDSGWKEQDYNEVIEKLTANLLTSEKLKNYIQQRNKKAYMTVGEIRDKTNHNIDINNLIRKFEYKIFNSNILEIVESADFRDQIRKERAEQTEFEKDEALKKWGKEAGADLILFGEVTLRVEPSKNRILNYYTVSLFLTDIETSARIWFGQEEIKRVQKPVEPTYHEHVTIEAPKQINSGSRGRKVWSGTKRFSLGIESSKVFPAFGPVYDGLKFDSESGTSLYLEGTFSGLSLGYFQLKDWFFSKSWDIPSNDPQSPWYHFTNSATGSFSTKDVNMMQAMSYLKLSNPFSKFSLTMTLELGALIFNMTSQAHIAINSLPNPGNSSPAMTAHWDGQQSASSVKFVYGMKYGFRCRITPKLDVDASAGFLLIGAVRIIKPYNSIYDISSVSSIFESKRLYGGEFMYAVRLNYILKSR